MVNADLPVAVLPIDQLYAHGDGRIGTAETLETARDVCGYPRPASQSSLFFLGSSSVDVPGFFFCMRCGGLTCHMRCAARAGLRPLTMRTKCLAAKYEPHRPTRRPQKALRGFHARKRRTQFALLPVHPSDYSGAARAGPQSGRSRADPWRERLPRLDASDERQARTVPLQIRRLRKR